MRTTRRRQPKALAMAVVMIVSGVGGLFLTQGTAAADVDSVRGTGYGISVRLAGSFVIPPTPDPTVNPPLLVANESSTDFGPHTASLVTIGGVLGVLNNGIAVGPVATQAANIVGENHLGSITSNSQVANISALSDALNIPLISTTCIANGDGFTTSVTVSNARLGLPPPLGAGAQLLDGPVAANTVIDVLGVATVRLHERQVVENVAPSGGNPGRTRVVVNGARISVPMDGSILEIILAQAECEAVGPDVLLPSTTTSTTVAPTTSTTAGATTTSTTAATTSTTAATTSTTAATTSTTAATTSTTAPPTGTIASTTTTTVAGVVTTVGSGVLVRTGSSLKPLAMLSMVSIVLGILLLIGSGRPLTANAEAAYGGGYSGGAPEKWGPVEVGKTIWAGFAMLIMGPGEFVLRRRRRRRGFDSD